MRTRPSMRRKLRRLVAATFMSGATFLNTAPILADSNTNRAPVPTSRDTALSGSPQMISPYFGFGALTGAPEGYEAMCRRDPAECREDTQAQQPVFVVMTRKRWSMLEDANAAYNLRIKPVSDMENYGRSEYWARPQNNMGDCEDYVLAKRADLIDRGWPRSALLITAVRKPDGEPHAVLVAVTNEGMLVLDNLEQKIKAWSSTPYTYLWIQNPAKPREWRDIIKADPPQWNTATLSATSTIPYPLPTGETRGKPEKRPIFSDLWKNVIR